jgi:hypothetical protein
MNKLHFILLLVCFAAKAELSGQHVSDHGTGVDVKPNAVGHVESGAVQANVDVHPGAFTGSLTVEKGVEVNVPPGAVQVKVDPITITAPPVTFNVSPEAVKLTLIVPPEAVKVTLTVADGAVRIEPKVELKVEKGAVIMTGAETGAVQTNIEVPWYWIVAGIGGPVGWLITKLRKPTVSRDIGASRSLVDVFF